MRYVLDTNAIIYLQKGALASPLPVGHYFASVITEMELLSFPSLSPEDAASLAELLSEIVVVPLDGEIKDRTVRIRREHGLAIPDAIVAATALALDAELVSNDLDFQTVPKLNIRRLILKK